AQEAIKAEAIRAGQYYVYHRWLGGTVTNWDTIQKRIARLKKIIAMEEDWSLVVLNNIVVAGFYKQIVSLVKFLVRIAH
ncbi:30S ribosomal protein S2, partial [Enterococcus faecalis]|uniref:30S ribosomal protein S2 n=1 Tax=Enterococcus faecalis TaxID=1351 RepID=UPI003CC5E15B